MGFDIQDGVLKRYTKEPGVTEVVIPDGVTSIGNKSEEKDDTSIVMERVEGMTLAQIMDFIKIAQEHNAVKVLAALMEYKNKTYPDYDVMDEFVLDW